jgi:uncharacterized membrane protein YqjE
MLSFLSSNSSDGLFEKGKKLLHNFVTLLQTRLELAGIELREELARLVQTFIFAIFGVILTSISLVLFSIALVVFFWEDPTQRLTAIACLGGVYLVVALCIFRYVSNSLKSALNKPFPETINQLKKDKEWLDPDHIS